MIVTSTDEIPNNKCDYNNRDEKKLAHQFLCPKLCGNNLGVATITNLVRTTIRYL